LISYYVRTGLDLYMTLITCFFQVHPLALCNDGVDDSLLEYGWVGVVKLEKPEVNPRPCLTLYEKVSYSVIFIAKCNFRFGVSLGFSMHGSGM